MSAVILFLARIIAKRVVFLHFYLMALGGLFMMIGGMMVVFFWGKYIHMEIILLMFRIQVFTTFEFDLYKPTS